MTSLDAANALHTRIAADKGEYPYIDERKLAAAVEDAGFRQVDERINSSDEHDALYCRIYAPDDSVGTHGVEILRSYNYRSAGDLFMLSPNPITRLVEVTDTKWVAEQEAD